MHAASCIYICIVLGSCLQVYDMLPVHAASCKCEFAEAIACKAIHRLCMPLFASENWPWLSIASVEYAGFACPLMQVWTCGCPFHGWSCRLQVCYGCGFRLQVCISKDFRLQMRIGFDPVMQVAVISRYIVRLTRLMSAHGLCSWLHVICFAHISRAADFPGALWTLALCHWHWHWWTKLIMPGSTR